VGEEKDVFVRITLKYLNGGRHPKEKGDGVHNPGPVGQPRLQNMPQDFYDGYPIYPLTRKARSCSDSGHLIYFEAFAFSRGWEKSRMFRK
jgi:hypothetical protein